MICDAYRSRIKIHEGRDDTASVLVDWGQIIQIDPSISNLSYRASLYEKNNDWDKLLADYTEMVRLELKQLDGLLKRADVRREERATGQSSCRVFGSDPNRSDTPHWLLPPRQDS